ncbi:MAG TPA: O-linked GlcNAc transferase-like protein [Candidatus Hungatella pullicola]|nr:O-linked GlcNAc transferase-like protein [Candidatus Hungatella pullicola]
MKKYAKGQYGYRDYRKKKEILKVCFGAVMILIQLGARFLTDNEAWKNILTVMAILSVLPTANVASPLVASWRFKTPSKDFYEKVSPYEKQFTVLYDLILTTKDSIIPVEAAAVHPTGVYACCDLAKADVAKAEKAFNEIFAGHKLDPNVKLIPDKSAFYRRLDSLKPASQYEDDGSVEYAGGLLKNLSM